MPFLLVLLALLLPRITILALWLFTHWFDGIFGHVLWPILGILFLPTTLLWYSVVYHWFGGQWSLIPVAGMVVALLIDLTPARSKRRSRVVMG